MNSSSTLGGQDLREMFTYATNWLEKSSADIDALNVFPVPDGDTGTNMLLTMRSTIEEAHRAPDHSAAAVAQAMAKGALMGARGNSGVILSQILRGLAQGMAGKENITAADLADALELSSQTAYQGITNPVEGTILTVIHDAAVAAKEQAAQNGSDIITVMQATVKAANESLARTPYLLPVLKEAGVVDAGGQGLYTILEGSLQHLMGESNQMRISKPRIVVSDLPAAARMPQAAIADEVPYGYCTEFLLKGEKLDPADIRKKLEKKGESLIVVGDESAVRIHIHSLDPGKVISFATRHGTLHQTSIRNMDEQHRDFLEMRKERAPDIDTAIVAVVAGDGLADVLHSLGVAAVVPGGQTMNPSTKEILHAVEKVNADKVIILPNNKNIIATAEQVKSLTGKTIEIVPTKIFPQGVAALLAFDYEADLRTNAEIMGKALASVRSIEITHAVRTTKVNGLQVKKKQPMGLLDGELVAAGDSFEDVISQILERLEMDKAEVVTIYYGADVTNIDAEQIATATREKYPHLQIELMWGGQPHYQYIISVE